MTDILAPQNKVCGEFICRARAVSNVPVSKRGYSECEASENEREGGAEQIKKEQRIATSSSD